VGGVKYIIRNLETAIIVKERRPELYADQLLDLINDEKKRAKMSQNGWNHVEEKFHYTTLVKNMDAYYKQLLRKKGVLK
ncbi:MAG: glycosyltransferase, partial [Crocinitomicaceae bacterium]